MKDSWLLAINCKRWEQMLQSIVLPVLVVVVVVLLVLVVVFLLVVRGRVGTSVVQLLIMLSLLPAIIH